MHARVAGWIEELYIDTTGVRVRQGQPVAAIFSQELFASQTEYLAVLRQTGDTPSSVVAEAARTRLAVLGMGEREIRALEREGAAPRLVTITAPHDGTVLRRGVSVGTAIDPSTELMTIADLSQVWVLAEVPEAYVGDIVPGTGAMLEFPAAGGTPLTAAVDFIYPTLTERTRSVRVRFVLPNPDGLLRPGMYGTASFDATGGREALTIPRDAVVETGASQHVFVQTQDEVLEPRQVRIGMRLADRVEIIEGLSIGDEVVSSGVFLIDSESRLRASSAGTGHAGHGAGAADGAERP
jgi:Cu(I)/Ag(I) efflux system membrane fusion protein